MYTNLRLREAHPDVALSAWPGEHGELARWGASGRVDVALSFEAPRRGNWSVVTLFEDRHVQASTVARKVQRWDPGYVYVDMGPELRRQHAAAYPIDETPDVTFGHSRWALEHILRWGGSAYLSLRLVRSQLHAGQPFRVEGAHEFRRTCYLAPDAQHLGRAALEVELRTECPPRRTSPSSRCVIETADFYLAGLLRCRSSLLEDVRGRARGWRSGSTDRRTRINLGRRTR